VRGAQAHSTSLPLTPTLSPPQEWGEGATEYAGPLSIHLTG
jgi:hypothetical protein